VSFTDWVQDKVRSKFALQGMCWQQSFIPKLIWQVGDSTTNIIESLHADANSEGTSCTLVGGVKKGQIFDKMKLQSLEVSFMLSSVPCAEYFSISSCLRQRVSDLHISEVTSPKIYLAV
jgi:hypothetical protein